MILATLFLSSVASGTGALVNHRFEFAPNGAVNAVFVAGTFNQWNSTKNPLTKESTGKWSTSVPLALGTYQYKFVVDGKWINDPTAPSEVDGAGNENSIIHVVPADEVYPAVPGDGVIAMSGLEHTVSVPYVNWDHGQLTISIRSRAHDLQKVRLHVAGWPPLPMTETVIDDLYSRFSVVVPWNRKVNLSYHFELEDGTTRTDFGPSGMGDKSDFVLEANGFRPFVVPAWVEKSVIYQIFPDRFENGDPSNDPKDVVPWSSKPTFRNHFGGDLAGVQKHMDYLKSLGISAIYFTPVFKANSNHRYDTVDYLQIDPELGTNKEFDSMTKNLRGIGIRSILDGVFNHTSHKFFAFDDVVKNGATSKYVDWYSFQSLPAQLRQHPNYETYGGFWGMPKLNYASSAVQKYVLDVPVFWAKDADVSGWRLDVGAGVPHEFWKSFRTRVKGLNPENWIIGEEWGDSSEWLKGDEWDSSMNYPFRSAVLGFVSPKGNGRPSTFTSKLWANYFNYAPQVSRNLMNSLSTHDTARILTECGGDQDLAKLAADVLFTWPGVPSVYYGDEEGMEGRSDPDNRRTMDWEAIGNTNSPNTKAPVSSKNTNSMLDHYRKLISLRRSNHALQSGEPEILSVDDSEGTFSFVRVVSSPHRELTIVAVNRSVETRKVVIPTSKFSYRTSDFVDALGGQPVTVRSNGQILVSLAPKSAAVLIPRTGSSRRHRLGYGSRRPAQTPTLRKLTS